MADKTGIVWTDSTWNPVTGCTRVSPGCENCYIDWAPPFRIEGRHFTTPCMHCDGDGFEPMGGRFKESHACSVCGGEGDIRSHAKMLRQENDELRTKLAKLADLICSSPSTERRPSERTKE